MEEQSLQNQSLQIKLAKSNINITDINKERILFEFPYHPRPGEVKWCKSFIPTSEKDDLLSLVLQMRKMLER